MPDIREIMNALSPDDRAVYAEARSNMRRAFLDAHNNTVGIANWEQQDDSLLDLIDIRLALLFDRSGRLNTITDIVGVKDGEKLQEHLDTTAADKLKKAWESGGGKNGK